MYVLRVCVCVHVCVSIVLPVFVNVSFTWIVFVYFCEPDKEYLF